MTKLVCFDPGHSYTNVNQSPDGLYYEWLACQDICEKALLLVDRIPGLEGMLTKETWEDANLATRVKRAHDRGAYLFLSHHTNAVAGGWSTTARGYGAYPHTTDDPELANTYLAEADRVIGHLMRSRGVCPANFYVTRETRMPALLVETGFHTNRDDVALLKTHEFRYLVAEVLVRTACVFLGVPFTVKNAKLFQAGMYYVVPDDNITQIASNNNLSRDELISYNPHVPNPNLILAEFGGDVIFLGEPTELQVEYGTLRREYIILKKAEPLWKERVEVLENQLRNLEQTLVNHKTIANKIISSASKIL